MIIGPNGTGKSTFVCAVCLGLAGSPLLLGRQKALAGFIKNGEQSAFVETTLKNKPGLPEIVIGREFYLTNKSDWFVNNKPSSEQRVKLLLKELNIQLDNLCQFLPQEKVADFAKLSPERLLEEVERAIEIDLLHKHQQLISLDREKREIDEELQIKQADLERLSEERKRFEEEARKYEAYQNKKAERETHEKLIPYAKIQDLKARQMECKKRRDQLRRDLEEFKELAKPYEDAAATFDGDVQACLNEVHRKKQQQEKIEEDVATYKKQLSDLEEKHEKLLSMIENQKTRAEVKKRDLQTSQDQLKQLEQSRDKIQLMDASIIDGYKSKRSELHGFETEIGSRISDKDSEFKRLERDEYNYKQEIHKTKQQFQSTDRVHILDGDSNYNNRQKLQAKKAVGLLRSAEFKKYRGQVYEPPCVSLSTTKHEYAAFLEEIVDYQTTFALTAVSRDVYDEVSDKIFRDHNINVSFRYLSNKRLDGTLSKEQLREFGFDGYLRDFVTGPKAVLQMLSEQSYIHDIPVSTKPLTDEQILRLQRPHNGQLLFRKFIAGDTIYALSASRYGSKQVTMRTSQVRMKPKYFSAGGMSEERKHQLNQRVQEAQSRLDQIYQRKDELAGQLAKLEEERAPIKDEMRQCQQYLKDAAHAKNEYEKISTRAQSLKERVKRLEQEANRDYTADIVKSQKKLRLVAEQRIKVLTNLSVVQIRLHSISEQISMLEVKKFDQENKKVSVKKLAEIIADEKKEIERQYAMAKREYQEFKNSTERKELMEQTMRYSTEEKEILNELIIKYIEQERFSAERLHDMIEGLDAELNLLGTGSKSSVNSLERINDQLETLTRVIPELQLQSKQKAQIIKEVHADWEPKLHELVHKISNKFSNIFPSVGSAGEVRVAKAEKYSDWRLEILVKFRDEADLKVLDSHTQSGGERAVSTVFFMISMQELTTSPFRVVDEINQGMDARNEKVVHKHMVQVACQENTSQYFLITPKLLTNLYYSEKMRVHCIMAGPWTPNPSVHQEYLSLGATASYA